MDELANHIIDELGGTRKVARLFDIAEASVSGWRKSGIPKSRMMYIKLAYPHLISNMHAVAEPLESGLDGSTP